jgi:hypothetical protein
VYKVIREIIDLICIVCAYIYLRNKEIGHKNIKKTL